jgi:hypothetical protein
MHTVMLDLLYTTNKLTNIFVQCNSGISCLLYEEALVQGVLPTVYKCKIKEPRKRRPRPDMGWSAIGWMHMKGRVY